MNERYTTKQQSRVDGLQLSWREKPNKRRYKVNGCSAEDARQPFESSKDLKSSQAKAGQPRASLVTRKNAGYGIAQGQSYHRHRAANSPQVVSYVAFNVKPFVDGFTQLLH
jgi:hypothetical protein